MHWIVEENGDIVMNKRENIYLLMFGTIATFLISGLTTLLYQVITWTPSLVEIASVTWNGNPLL